MKEYKLTIHDFCNTLPKIEFIKINKNESIADWFNNNELYKLRHNRTEFTTAHYNVLDISFLGEVS